jgi:hypothetical protein
MESRTEICREILRQFLDRWSANEVGQMTLEQYVSVGDKDTFCQWLETKTRVLGSIKGVYSWKFGIYKRQDQSKRPKTLYNDKEYSWLKFYGDDRSEAFKKIINEILQIIHCADTGQFEQIDNLHLPQFVRWKIAFLYSNERLIPIFKKDVLVKIAAHFGLAANPRTPNSAIQRVMIAKKPARLSVYDYMTELYAEFGGGAKDETETGKRRRRIRRAAAEKNIETQTRQGTAAHVVTQKHNKLQEKLRNKLIAKYGEEMFLWRRTLLISKLFSQTEFIFTR